MNDRRYAVMFLRLGFLASVVFAVFWGVWHLFGYEVPAYTSLKLMENMSLTLPISRWWDIPFAFLLVNMYAWLLRVYYKFSLKFARKDDVAIGLVVGLVAGLVASLVVGLAIGLTAGLGVGLVAGLYVLFSSNFCKVIYNWFVARNIA